MGQAHNQAESWDEYEKASAVLRENVAKLEERGRQELENFYGSSENFSKKVMTPEIAMNLCDRAMEKLSHEYVDAMLRFKESEKPVDALEALEEAEVTWHAEATIIRQLDAEGGETEFLSQIRQMAYQVLENRLATITERSREESTEERVALCLGILAVMDQILEAEGKPVTTPLRQRFREIARAFII